MKVRYYSRFYKRYICQYIYSRIKRNHDLNINYYSEKEKDFVQAKNGVYENNKLFTPDNLHCFA